MNCRCFWRQAIRKRAGRSCLASRQSGGIVNKMKIGLAFHICSCYPREHGNSSLVSRPDRYGCRYCFYPSTDRRQSGFKPAGSFSEAVRSLELAAGQRGLARDGMPQPHADASSGRPHRVAAGSLGESQSFGPARGGSQETDSGACGYDAAAKPIWLQSGLLSFIKSGIRGRNRFSTACSTAITTLGMRSRSENI